MNEIITHSDGKTYRKLNRDEKIARGAIHCLFDGEKNFLMNPSESVGKTPNDFSRDRDFYNPEEVFLTIDDLTPKQKERVWDIMAQGYSVTLRHVYKYTISVVAHKDNGSIYLDEGYHIFVGARGSMCGVSSSNLQCSNTIVEKRKHEKVLIALFYSKVFGSTKAGRIRLIG